VYFYILAVQQEEAQARNLELNQRVYTEAKRSGWRFTDYIPERPQMPEISMPLFSFVDRSWNINFGSSAPPQPPRTEERRSAAQIAKEKEEARARRYTIGGIGLIIGAPAALGYCHKLYRRTNAAAQRTKDHFDWAFNTLPYTPIKGAILDFYDHKYQIDKIVSGKITGYVYTAGGILAGGVLMLAGGLFTVSWMMTAGLVVAVASTAFGMYMYCYHLSDAEDIQTHREALLGRPPNPSFAPIKGLGDMICENLNQYNNDMTSMVPFPGAVPVNYQFPQPSAPIEPAIPSYYNYQWSQPPINSAFLQPPPSFSSVVDS
jgi:hypothetical protein